VRLGGKHALDGLDTNLFGDTPEGIQPGNVVEFSGQEGSGKSEMLLHLIANCILPKSWKDLKLNGKSVSIVYVDTDYHFQLLRLVTIMEHRILNRIKDNQTAEFLENNRSNTMENISGNYSDHYPEKYSDYEDFIKSCLGRLFIVHSNSSIQFLATILSLENLLAAKPEVGVFMIDSLSAFYWLDRCSGGESQSHQEHNQRKIVDVIRKYTRQYHVVLIATKQAIFASSDKSAHREHLCQAWQRLVNYRFEFDKSKGQNGMNQIYSVCRTYQLSKKHLRFYIKESGIEFVP